MWFENDMDKNLQRPVRSPNSFGMGPSNWFPET